MPPPRRKCAPPTSFSSSPPRYELYDLQADPYEFRNLTASPEHAAVFADLKQRLLAWREQTQDPLLNPTNLARLKAEVYAVNSKAEGKAIDWGYPDYFFGKEPATTARNRQTRKRKRARQNETSLWFSSSWRRRRPLFAADAASAEKPNVLMIIADDLNDWVGCLQGHPDVKTPNIDRLAKRGLLFANAHCAAPVCNPSRVATFTGRRPSSSGVYGNDTVWHEVLPGVPTIPQHFKANGYHVAGGGKVYHHPPGFNRRSDWNEYFDQVFDGHYQAQWAKGEKPKNFTWPEGFPLNQLPNVKALTTPPVNPNEFDWGPFDKTGLRNGRRPRWSTGPRSFCSSRPGSRSSSPRASTVRTCRGMPRASISTCIPPTA